MIASFSFASTGHVTQWSNYLTQRAEILTPRSNLTPQEEHCELFVPGVCGTKVTFEIKQVGFTASLFSPRPASCSQQFTLNGSNFG